MAKKIFFVFTSVPVWVCVPQSTHLTGYKYIVIQKPQRWVIHKPFRLFFGYFYTLTQNKLPFILKLGDFWWCFLDEKLGFILNWRFHFKIRREKWANAIIWIFDLPPPPSMFTWFMNDPQGVFLMMMVGGHRRFHFEVRRQRSEQRGEVFPPLFAYCTTTTLF